MTKKNIPFDFVFDYLPLDVTVKPMFGLWAINLKDKIVLVLRQRNDFVDTNGVWIATSKDHHKSLQKDFPALRSIPIFPKDAIETEWQLLPADSEDFESAVVKVCEFIKHNDPRIGRIPLPRNAGRRKKLR